MSSPSHLEQWVEVADTSDIPIGEGRAYALEGRQVAVFHQRDGSVRVLSAVCPHLGGPLADGLTDDAVVVCPLHGFTYDLLTGEETSNGAQPVTVFESCVETGGKITIRVAGNA